MVTGFSQIAKARGVHDPTTGMIDHRSRRGALHDCIFRGAWLLWKYGLSSFNPRSRALQETRKYENSLPTSPSHAPLALKTSKLRHIGNRRLGKT